MHRLSSYMSASPARCKGGGHRHAGLDLNKSGNEESKTRTSGAHAHIVAEGNFWTIAALANMLLHLVRERERLLRI